MMLNAFQSTQAEEKWPFDISILSLDVNDDFSKELTLIESEVGNSDHYIYNIYQDGTSVMTDFLLDNISGANEYSYFPKDTFMKLSDYNVLRAMLGYEQVTLEQGHYPHFPRSGAERSPYHPVPPAPPWRRIRRGGSCSDPGQSAPSRKSP